MRACFLGLPIFLCATIFTLQAEDSIGLVFPLEKQGNQVFVKHSVLLNEHCIVQAGALARIMFIPPRSEDADVKKIRRKVEDNPAFSRAPHNPHSEHDDNLTPEQRAALDRALKETWNEDISFRAAMERWDLDDARFVFQQPHSSDPKIETIIPPEGMFLAEINGKVTVLHVQKDSAAANAGIIPQITLLSFNEKPLSSLKQFQEIYLQEKKSARKLDFLAQLPSGEQKTFSIKRPMSLNSDIWAEMDKR